MSRKDDRRCRDRREAHQGSVLDSAKRRALTSIVDDLGSMPRRYREPTFHLHGVTLLEAVPMLESRGTQHLYPNRIFSPNQDPKRVGNRLCRILFSFIVSHIVILRSIWIAICGPRIMIGPAPERTTHVRPGPFAAPLLLADVCTSRRFYIAAVRYQVYVPRKYLRPPCFPALVTIS